MAEPTTAPVTAEDLRATIQQAISDPGAFVPLVPGEYVDNWSARAVVAALAVDPGDLPARMAEAIGAALEQRDASAHPGDEFGRMRDHLAAAAMSVRSEDTAALAARLAEAERRAEHAEGQLSALRDHGTRWETERARAETAEFEVRVIERAAVHQRERAEAAEAQVAALQRELAEERAKHEAELASLQRLADRFREQDDRRHVVIVAERDEARKRADWLRSHAEWLSNERDAIAAAARKALEVRQTHHKTAHPARLIDPACDFCQVLLVLSRSLPARPDDPEEIRRLAQATTEETNA